MSESPAQVIRKLADWNDFKEFNRNSELELMLVAIEENSGCMAKLASVNWNFNLNLQRDSSKPMHYQTELIELKNECFFDNSEFL